MGRVNAWHMAFNLASDRFFGGGFETFQREAFAMYAPIPGDVHDSHSIYFEVLGEHGFVGLGLFLLFGLFAWLTASRLAKSSRKDPQLRWAADLASMYQASVAGYYTAGLFVGLAYFDLYYHIVALMLLANAVVAREKAARADGGANSARTRTRVEPRVEGARA
jgi:probable O-glycosylation ligase (exosortase A-associated)